MKYTIEKDSVYGNVSRFADVVEEAAAVAEAMEIVKPYGLVAEMLPPDVMTRGNQGDEGSYTRVIALSGNHPGDEALSMLSTKISNRIPVNKVVFEIASKSPK